MKSQTRWLFEAPPTFTHQNSPNYPLPEFEDEWELDGFENELDWETGPTINLDKAVAYNRSKMASVGWQTHVDRIVALLGFSTYTPDERTFAQAVATWQQKQGLTPDGMIGPNTWAKMQAALGLKPAAPKPSGPPPTNFKQKLKDIAQAEWKFFNFGKKKESQDGAWQRVGKYWKEGIGANLDGRNTDVPWSAAFISWVIKQAGAGNRFKYSAGHSVYIRDAIQKRKTNDPNAAFKGYRLSEVAPQVGDLVCASRANDAGKVGYDTTRDYASHCDIVVATRSGEVDVIGGNVNDSVSKKTLKVDSQGKLIPSGNLFVVIKNLL